MVILASLALHIIKTRLIWLLFTISVKTWAKVTYPTMSSALIFKVALRAIEGRDVKDATDTMLVIVINSFSIIFIRKTQVYVSLKVTFVVDV